MRAIVAGGTRACRRAYSTSVANQRSSPIKLLVVEAYDKAGRERLASVGVQPASDTFGDLLPALMPEGIPIDVSVIQPADSAAHMMEVSDLERYDGVVWTGSSLTIHEDTPEVARQVELARRCYKAAVPQYGSCWGLQISAAAAGIPCEPNPRGREHGIARGISLTPEGLAHPLFDGTMARFDSTCAHTDQVAAGWALAPHCLPGVSATVLASNDWSPVQALSVRVGAGEFWSVQYHPELALGDVARLMRLPVPRRMLVAQGDFSSEAELLAYTDALESLAADPANAELRARLRIGDDVLDPSRRSRELANWLHNLVLPTAARDLEHVRGLRTTPRPLKTPTLKSATAPTAAAAPAATGVVLSVDNPYSGEEAARVPMVSRAEAVAQTVSAAGAQREWAHETSVAERVEVCARFLDALDADGERIATEVSAMMGKPLAAARGELRGVRERAEMMMALAPEELAPEPLPQKPNLSRRIDRVPIGVVLCIAPWNYPLLTAVNCVVPAVLAGNAVQLKASPRSPLAADAFARAFRAAGAPEGLVTPLHCENDVVDATIGLPEVGLVSFTGSVAVGRKVHASASRRFIDTILELGGKCAAYVAADADVAAAAESLVDGAFFNAGQSCCAIERVYVHESVHDEFVAAAATLVRAYQLGDPMDPSTSLGPLALPGTPPLLAAQVADAAAKGARVVVGDGTVPERGRFFAPTLLDRCDHSMAIMRDESFGPVLGIAKVSSDDEAARMMDDSAYGLTASIWTSDAQRAETIAASLRVGTVFMNRCDYLDPMLPWTGFKHSGKGVSLSRHGFRAFTRLKGLHFRMDPRA